jgi:hypothetical protein
LPGNDTEKEEKRSVEWIHGKSSRVKKLDVRITQYHQVVNLRSATDGFLECLLQRTGDVELGRPLSHVGFIELVLHEQDILNVAEITVSNRSENSIPP